MLEPSGLELDRRPRRTTLGYSLDPMVEVVNEKRGYYPSQKIQKENITRAQWENAMVKAKYTTLCALLVASIAGALGAPLTACAALGAFVVVGLWVCTEVS